MPWLCSAPICVCNAPRVLLHVNLQRVSAREWSGRAGNEVRTLQPASLQWFCADVLTKQLSCAPNRSQSLLAAVLQSSTDHAVQAVLSEKASTGGTDVAGSRNGGLDDRCVRATPEKIPQTTSSVYLRAAIVHLICWSF